MRRKALLHFTHFAHFNTEIRATTWGSSSDNEADDFFSCAIRKRASRCALAVATFTSAEVANRHTHGLGPNPMNSERHHTHTRRSASSPFHACIRPRLPPNRDRPWQAISEYRVPHGLQIAGESKSNWRAALGHL